MALQYVGGNTGTWAGATSGNNNVSLTALTGGLASSAAAGDIVIAVYSTGSSANRTLSISDGTTAYTLIGSELYSNGTSYDTNLRVAYKILSAADANTVFGPTGNAQDAGTAAVYVWRGVDSVTPLDVTTTTNTGTGTGRPTPPAITPTTTGAIIICVGGGAAATGATYTTATLSSFRTVTSSDNNDAMLGIGYFAWSSGTYTPAQFGGGTANAADSWAAITLALRPSFYTLTCNNGTYSLTGQSAGLYRSKLITANNGTYTVTGKTATVSRSKLIAASNGTYALTGQSVTLAKGRVLTASNGTYSVTGQTVSIYKSKLIDASAGTYSVTGQSASLSHNHLIEASAGSYSVTGQSADIYKSKNIDAAAGTYAVTGQTVTIAKSVLLDAGYGSYTYTGYGVNMAIGTGTKYYFVT